MQARNNNPRNGEQNGLWIEEKHEWKRRQNIRANVKRQKIIVYLARLGAQNIPLALIES